MRKQIKKLKREIRDLKRIATDSQGQIISGKDSTKVIEVGK